MSMQEYDNSSKQFWRKKVEKLTEVNFLWDPFLHKLRCNTGSTDFPEIIFLCIFSYNIVKSKGHFAVFTKDYCLQHLPTIHFFTSVTSPTTDLTRLCIPFVLVRWYECKIVCMFGEIGSFFLSVAGKITLKTFLCGAILLEKQIFLVQFFRW